MKISATYLRIQFSKKIDGVPFRIIIRPSIILIKSIKKIVSRKNGKLAI